MNPNDKFPPRNLPPDATPWARAVEKEVRGAEKAIQAIQETAKSENRATAAVTADLARQLEKLSEFLEELEELLEEIEELYKLIPKVYQFSETSTAFGVGSDWTAVATLTVTPPEGATTVALTAFGQAVAWAQPTGLVGLNGRIVIAGNTGGVFQASVTPLGEFQAVVNPQHGRTFSSSEPFTIELQLRPEEPSVYTPNSKNSATITVVASFTGV